MKQLLKVSVKRSESGQLIDSVQPEQVAVMVVATMEGCISTGMISQDLQKLMFCGEGLIQYLNLIQRKPTEK